MVDKFVNLAIDVAIVIAIGIAVVIAFGIADCAIWIATCQTAWDSQGKCNIWQTGKVGMGATEHFDENQGEAMYEACDLLSVLYISLRDMRCVPASFQAAGALPPTMFAEYALRFRRGVTLKTAVLHVSWQRGRNLT